MTNLQSQTVTLYPIIFAIITARAMKKLAAWKLEKGSSLESLEQFMGSLSTGGTLSTIYTLRSYNLLAAGLVAIWALSPIGGQASLFLVHTQREPVFSDINVQYLDTNGNTTFSSGDYNTVLEPLNALFSSLVMAPTWSMNDSYDLWQNLKIPDLLRAGATNSSGWIPISKEPDGTGSYASLLGVPIFQNVTLGNITVPTEITPNLTGFTIGGLTGTTTFLMETSYISVACLNVTSGPPIEVIDGTFNSTSATFSNSSALLIDNGPNLSFALDGFDTTQRFIGGPLNSSNSPINFTQDQRTLLVQSRITGGSFPYAAYARAYCPLSKTYLTASVSCIDVDCGVIAIQRSQQPPAPPAWIPFAYASTFGEFAQNLAAAMPIPEGMAQSMSSPVELYIQDPNFIESGTLFNGYTNLALVPVADFSLRLQQVINAYWHGSLGPTAMIGVMDPDLVLTASTKAKNVMWRNVYRCQWGWWAAYVFATTVMFIATIASLTLDFILKSPEFLGYCSSLVRDSRFFDTRYGTGSAIGGAERARMFKTLRLKLVDVGGETGNARLAVVEDGTKERELLKRGRLYS